MKSCFGYGCGELVVPIRRCSVAPSGARSQRPDGKYHICMTVLRRPLHDVSYHSAEEDEPASCHAEATWGTRVAPFLVTLGAGGPPLTASSRSATDSRDTWASAGRGGEVDKERGVPWPARHSVVRRSPQKWALSTLISTRHHPSGSGVDEEPGVGGPEPIGARPWSRRTRLRRSRPGHSQ